MSDIDTQEDDTPPLVVRCIEANMGNIAHLPPEMMTEAAELMVGAMVGVLEQIQGEAYALQFFSEILEDLRKRNEVPMAAPILRRMH